jgi:hypothetical protein
MKTYLEPEELKLLAAGDANNRTSEAAGTRRVKTRGGQR